MTASDQVDYVSGKTRLFGIVGHPIEQVRSPEMITAEMTGRGHDAVLVPMHVLPDAFDAVLEHASAKWDRVLVLGDLVGLVTKHLKKGDRIRIGGLGILVVRKRAARMGRNPATGEPIQIKASKKVAFRAAKELKEAV